MPNPQFKDEYNSNSLVELEVRGCTMFVTPRFVEHYQSSSNYEALSVDLFESLVEKGQNIIDIGAHYGYYSLVAAKKAGPTGKVLSIEPVEFNRKILSKNVKANELESVISVVPSAVSDKKGVAKFNIAEASDNSGFYSHPRTQTVKSVEIETTTIDELTKNRVVTLLKVDAEGHENAILDGATKLLSQESLVVFFEFNPKCFVVAKQRPELILERLLSSKFRLYLLNDKTREVFRLRSPASWRLLMNDQEYRNIVAIKKSEELKFKERIHTLGAKYHRNLVLPRLRSLLSSTYLSSK
jgi:FkbM family methyltransferase